MRLALTTAGYAALEMSDGRALIETLEQGGIDLILLDVMLPGEDGFTLLDKIRRYQVPVIFVSARSQLADKVQALQAGADDYEGTTRTVDMHIASLRKKLGLNRQIVSVYKIGYRLEDRS